MENQKAKKPFYKKWWFWVIIAVILISVIAGAGGGKDKEQPKNQPPVVDSKDPKEVDTPADDADAARSAFAESMGNGTVLFDESVRNDVTGKWRLLRVSSPEDIVDHAVDYYNAYFGSDDEIHFVVNFTLGTTTRISCAAGSLFVDELEYVSGEEHDAKILASGDLLKQYIVHLDTGKVEDITNAD